MTSAIPILSSKEKRKKKKKKEHYFDPIFNSFLKEQEHSIYTFPPPKWYVNDNRGIAVTIRLPNVPRSFPVNNTTIEIEETQQWDAA